MYTFQFKRKKSTSRWGLDEVSIRRTSENDCITLGSVESWKSWQTFEKPRMNFKSSTKSKPVKKGSEKLCVTSSILYISNRAHDVFQISLFSLLDSYACSLVFKPEGTEQLKVLETGENLNSVLWQLLLEHTAKSIGEKFCTELIAFLQEELNRNEGIHTINSQNPDLEHYETTSNQHKLWKEHRKSFLFSPITVCEII